MKPGMRILGVDDGPFKENGNSRVLVVGAVYRGRLFDGLISTRIVRDGYNSTERLCKMITGSKFHQQLHAVMLDGIALGGFNVIDILKLNKRTHLPIIVVSRRKPDLNAVKNALGKLPRSEYRWKLIKRAGPIHKAGSVWFQVSGASVQWAAKLIASAASRSNIPEPIRAAHLIAGGLINGESGRRA